MKLKYKHIRYSEYITLFAVILIVNVLSHFLKNVLNVGNTYWASYVCWIVYLVVCLFSNVRYSKRFFVLWMVLSISCLIGYVSGNSCGYLDNGDILNTGIFIMTMFSCLVINPIKKVQIWQLNVIFYIIWIFSVGAAFFMVIYQGHLITDAFGGSEYASWGLFSFFGQRNVYAGYCFISVIAATYLYLKKGKAIYIITSISILIIILATGSRSSLVACLTFILMLLYLKTKKKWYLWVFVAIAFIGIAIQFDVLSIMMKRFSHSTNLNVDSGVIRLRMWGSGIKNLVKNYKVLDGYGIGSTSLFLRHENFAVESFHNIYIEYLFEGGLVLIGVFVYSIISSIKKIKRVNDTDFRYIWIAGLISYLLYSSFESGMALFMSNYLSITSTIIFVLLPKTLQGE